LVKRTLRRGAKIRERERELSPLPAETAGGETAKREGRTIRGRVLYTPERKHIHQPKERGSFFVALVHKPLFPSLLLLPTSSAGSEKIHTIKPNPRKFAEKVTH
jgi:hypothetical protein